MSTDNTNEQNDVVEETLERQAPVFDTRVATKNKILYLIVDDGTKEGKKVKFEIRPITSDVYLNVQAEQEKLKNMQKVQSSAKSELNKAKEIMKAGEVIDKLIMPIVTPNKPFRDWVKATLDSGAYVVYRQVMNAIINLAYDGIEKQPQS